MLHNAKQILVSELVLAEHATKDEVEASVRENCVNNTVFYTVLSLFVAYPFHHVLPYFVGRERVLLLILIYRPIKELTLW